MNKKHATIPETLISEKEIKKCQNIIVNLPSKNKEENIIYQPINLFNVFNSFSLVILEVFHVIMYSSHSYRNENFIM